MIKWNKEKTNRVYGVFIWKGVFMNTKENILDAWIVVENLSEGSIDTGEQGMMTLDRETENWEEDFRDFLKKNKEKEKLSDKAFQKSGLVLFLGIFDFDEVIDILKKKYNLEDVYEDRSKSKKFTAALFFDKDLQFLGNKFFYTMSGYIRNYGDFPKDIGEAERNLSDEIRGKFERERNKENGFHSVVTWILKKYKADISNFRYKFVRNLEKDVVNLHSFFIRDLEKAKKLDTENLKRYLKEEPGERVNLDSRKESLNFYPEIFEKILQPQNYPDGRFPGNSDYALAFMQQTATNIAIHDPENMRSVNGPSGTGKVLRLIGMYYNVSEKYLSANTSVQTLMDDAGKYGFYKKEQEWIGIPLWVHRRSDYPMFTISNEISYNGLMVQGKPEDKAQGRGFWYSVKGTANDKFVKEQADFLVDLISKRLEKEESLKEKIYVISPFRNVAQQTARELDRIQFTKRDKKGPVNVGTVHTFQGKEAKIVYLILGADEASKGAASWAVSEPNIMNVAATRAKEEFYIIGDKELYNNLGSKTANKTIRILEEYGEGKGR